MQKGCKRWKLEDKWVLDRLAMQLAIVSKYSKPRELDPIMETPKNRCKWAKIQIRKTLNSSLHLDEGCVLKDKDIKAQDTMDL